MQNRILLLIFGALLTASFGFAQKCGTYEGSLEEDIQKYPDFYKSIQSKNADLELNHEKALSKMTSLKVENGVKIIPVVVHVIHDMGNENISDASIQGALDILNANINGQASNFLDKTPDVFAAVRGDAKLEFRLAKLTPSCDTCTPKPTTGINRVRSTLTYEPVPGNAVKKLSYWNSYQYLNIWTVQKFAPQDDGATLLGYAQFPNSGMMSTDGVVLLASQMVNGGTLTHEVGHWLGLRHTWGDAVCGDDNIKDTPPAREANHGVFFSDFPYHVGNIGIGAGCLGDSMNWAGEMFMNYMDYGADSEKTMFTLDQNTIMNITLDGEFNEEDSVDGIGYREYMWSIENIAATGTADGFRVPTCTQEATFVVMNGTPSICKGEALLLKGNKAMFGDGNVNSFIWDFGDGNTDDSGEDFLSHTFSSVGSYNVSLSVEYIETTEARAANLSDLDLSAATSYDSIVKTIIVQALTEQELIDMGATNIQPHQLDSLAIYYAPNYHFWRGQLEKKTYIAFYENTCLSSVVKTDFVNVSNTIASSNESSYSYSFENETDLNADWVLNESTNIESEWNFNSGDNTIWKWENGVAFDGFSSLKVDKDEMLVGVSTEIISKAYDLSGLSTPAIKFSWAGAAVNNFPVNTLNVAYSDDCGESWRDLGIVGAVEAANAGLYTTSFKPDTSEWNSIVMTKAQLNSSNIKFKFEYVVNGISNNFYLDNIRIGEESTLIISENMTSSKLSIFPNPANGSTTIALENLANLDVDVTIINMLGAEVGKLYTGEIVSKYQEIFADISNLEKGIYFVKITNNGDVIMTDKLIVK